MKAEAFAFRFRVLIFLSLYLAGFTSPWEGYLTHNAGATLWLGASSLLARPGWIGLAASTAALTVAALASLLAGAALRVWGTAYLGPTVVQGTDMHGERVVAAGPYRHVRNPLYLGSYLLGVGVSILMPLTGALFFLLSSALFTLVLISIEERFLTRIQGDAYRAYCRQVPRLLPQIRGVDTGPHVDPHWLAAFLAEIYPVGITICFAIFSWRYNAHILLRCVLICYGLSLVIRALVKKPKITNPIP